MSGEQPTPDEVVEGAADAAKRVIDENTPIQEGVEHGPSSPKELDQAFNRSHYDYGFNMDRADLQVKEDKADTAAREGRIGEEAAIKLYDDIQDAHRVIDRKEMDIEDAEESRRLDDEYYAEHGHSFDEGLEDDEDPLAGDVDKYVPEHETRSDAQVARDDEAADRAHMSGADGADEYWSDYDSYHGAQTGEPKEPQPQ